MSKDSDMIDIDIRDMFAMAAMQGLVSTAKNMGQSIEDIAKLSYQYADAMIKARQHDKV